MLEVGVKFTDYDTSATVYFAWVLGSSKTVHFVSKGDPTGKDTDMAEGRQRDRQEQHSLPPYTDIMLLNTLQVKCNGYIVHSLQQLGNKCPCLEH
jgi:hypothetical protein